MLSKNSSDAENKIYKIVVFVRHGQYQNDPEELTSLGREQAKLSAPIIKQLEPKKIYSSTMPRAFETATIISRYCRLKVTRKKFFCEGLLPGTTEFMKERLNSKSTIKERLEFIRRTKKNKAAADQAFKFIMKPPKSGQSHEVVVAHGNVIRHWVCKALKIDETKWLSMDVVQASLTYIRVDGLGKFTLLGFSDCGHIPANMRTYL